MKLVRTLRGDGVLLARGSETPVAYGIDVFGEGPRRTAKGSIEGACAPFAHFKSAHLRLADGLEVEIGLEVQDAHGALVEILEPESLTTA